MSCLGLIWTITAKHVANLPADYKYPRPLNCVLLLNRDQSLYAATWARIYVCVKWKISKQHCTVSLMNKTLLRKQHYMGQLWWGTKVTLLLNRSLKKKNHFTLMETTFLETNALARNTLHVSASPKALLLLHTCFVHAHGTVVFICKFGSVAM